MTTAVKTPIAELLQSFCSQGESGMRRFDTTKPFTVGDWTYATDGRIAIRVLRKWYDPGFRENHPSLVTLEWNPPGLYHVLRSLIDAPLLTGTCDECQGMQHVECNYGFEHVCPNCDGTGVTESWSRTKVAGWDFADNLLAEVWSINPEVVVIGDKMHFKSTLDDIEVQGILMGMKPE